MKKLYPLFGIIIIVLSFSGLFYYQKQIAPKQITKLKIALDIPTQYAFVSDKNSKKLAVIDTFTNQVINYIELKEIPTLMKVSKDKGVLAYIGKSNILYILDLVEYSTKSKQFLENISEITFDTSGGILAAAGEKNVFLTDIRDLKTNIISDFSAPISLNYSSEGRFLFITEMQNSKVSKFDILENKKSLFFKGEKTLAETSIMPDSSFGLIAEANNLIIKNIFEDKQIKLDFKATLNRAFVSINNQTVIISDKSNNIYLINPNNKQISTQFHLDNNIQTIKTGWLETIGIAITTDSINAFELKGNNSKNITKTKLTGIVNDDLVMSDSKIMIFTQQNSKNLHIYNIRNKSLDGEISLELTQPNLVSMGLTNTACH